MLTDYSEDQLAHKMAHLAHLNQREILLAVAGLNGIKDIGEVTPGWLQPSRSKSGVTEAGARDVLLAAELRFLKSGAIAALGMTLADVEALAR